MVAVRSDSDCNCDALYLGRMAQGTDPNCCRSARLRRCTAAVRRSGTAGGRIGLQSLAGRAMRCDSGTEDGAVPFGGQHPADTERIRCAAGRCVIAADCRSSGQCDRSAVHSCVSENRSACGTAAAGTVAKHRQCRIADVYRAARLDERGDFAQTGFAGTAKPCGAVGGIGAVR